MDAPETQVSTPTGYTVQFRPFLTTAGRRAIQRTMARYMPDLSPESDLTEIRVSMEGALAAEEMALQHLIASVKLPDGSEVDDPVAAVAAMPEADGSAVYAQVNALTNANRSSEEVAKNGSSVSPASSGE